MRKVFRFAYAAIAIVVAASCAKEVAQVEPCIDEAQGSDVVILTASIDDLSKATFDGAKVEWESTDEIAVFDGTAKNKFTVVSCEGKTAVFSGTVTDGATDLYAVYPFSAGTALDGENLTVAIPAEQSIAAGKNVDDKALVMVGKAVDGEISFANVVSLAKVVISEDDVDAFSISGNAGENIAGAVSTSAAGIISSDAQAAKVVVSAASGSLAKGTYYAAVAPATLSTGLCVKVDMDGAKAFKTGASAAAFVRSKVLPLGDVIATGDVVADPIMNVAQLKAWAKCAPLYEAGEVARIGADIDLKDVDFDAAKTYKGVMDGQNHCLYNYYKEYVSTSSTPESVGILVNKLDGGTVKNIIIGSADGEAWDNLSGLQLKGSAAALTAGGVVGEICNGALLDNCKNFAYIMPAGNNATYPNTVGGVAGAATGTASAITNCWNMLEVRDNDNVPNTAGPSQIGGILGTDKAGCTISGCTNAGEVHANNPSTQRVAGIVAYVLNSGKTTITGCTNASNVIAHNAAKPYHIGGIVGKADSCVEIKDCVNAAGTSVKSSMKTAHECYIGGIIGYDSNTAQTSIFSGCENKGDVRIENVTNNPTVVVGGVCGLVYGTIKDCVNSGVVCCDAGTDCETYIGGVHGGKGNEDIQVKEITGCVNDGQVIFQKGKASSYIGGICGYFQFGLSYITNCSLTSNSRIEVRPESQQYAGAIAGYSRPVTKGSDKYVEDCLIDGVISYSNTAISKTYTGILLGAVRKKADSTPVAWLYIGSPSKPCVIAKTFKYINYTTKVETVLTKDNYKPLLTGSGWTLADRKINVDNVILGE